MRHFLIAVVLVLFAATSGAQEPASGDEWQFRLTPYVWLAGVTGYTGTEDFDLPQIEPGYQFFTLENFDGVFFMAFAAQKGQWAIHTDFVYLSFADSFPDGLVQSTFDLTGYTVELSAGYRPASWQNTQLIFGARGIWVDLEASLSPGPTGDASSSFVDPIVGISYERQWENKWGLMARGDIGAGSSEMMVNAVLAGTYQFTDLFTLAFGYRYLEVDFEDSDMLLDVSFQGYSIGFQFDW